MKKLVKPQNRRVICHTIAAEAIPIILTLINMHTKRLQEPHKNTLALFFKRVHCLFSVFPVLLLLAAISSSQLESAFLPYPLK